MNRQLAKLWLTTAELCCCFGRCGGKLIWQDGGMHPGMLSPGSTGALAGCQEAGAKPRCNVSLLSSLVRSAAAFTAFQVFLNHLQKQD